MCKASIKALRSGIVARLESEKERVFFNALILIQSLIRTSCYSHLFTTLTHHTSLTQSYFYSRQLWIKRLEEKFLKASQVLYKFCKQSTCRLIHLSLKHSIALIIRNIRRSFIHAAIRIHKVTLIQTTGTEPQMSLEVVETTSDDKVAV